MGLTNYLQKSNIICLALFLDIPYNESEGACWARNLIQQLYNNEEFKVFIQNKFTDNAFIKINNINFHYNFKECNKIFPWDLKPDDMCIITYGPINKRNIKTFFVKEIKKNFNKIIMVNKNCKKKIINFL